jgi:hypothetical protein
MGCFTFTFVGPRASHDWCRISRPPSRFQPRIVQPVGSRYTDWAAVCEYVRKTSLRITYSSGNHLVARQRAEQVTAGGYVA